MLQEQELTTHPTIQTKLESYKHNRIELLNLIHSDSDLANADTSQLSFWRRNISTKTPNTFYKRLNRTAEVAFPAEVVICQSLKKNQDELSKWLDTKLEEIAVIHGSVERLRKLEASLNNNQIRESRSCRANYVKYIDEKKNEHQKSFAANEANRLRAAIASALIIIGLIGLLTAPLIGPDTGFSIAISISVSMIFIGYVGLIYTSSKTNDHALVDTFQDLDAQKDLLDAYFPAIVPK